MKHADADFQSAFDGYRYNRAEIFYLGESVLLPSYRGQGIGHQFFDAREAQACKYGSRYAAFCAVNREPDDPRRPETYRSLEPCWKKRGYIQQPDIKATFDWREVGKPLDSSHTLTFWIKELTS